MRVKLSVFPICIVVSLAFLWGSIAYGVPVATKEVGEQVPSFSFTDVNGSKGSLNKLLEKYDLVVVNFWGLRCASCIQEIPHLNEMSEEFGDRVKFIGVNADAVDGGFLKDQMEYMGLEISYTVVPDPEFKLIDLFGLTAAPLTIVIGKDGKVVYRHEGYNLGDEKELKKALEEYLSRCEAKKIGSK